MEEMEYKKELEFWCIFRDGEEKITIAPLTHEEEKEIRQYWDIHTTDSRKERDYLCALIGKVAEKKYGFIPDERLTTINDDCSMTCFTIYENGTYFGHLYAYPIGN